LTLLLFYAAGLWDEPLASSVVILGALLVHELGHLLAMKALGYNDVRLFFIPFFGAAVSGRNPTASGGTRALVTIAGPLAGLAGAFGLFALWFRVDSPHLPKAALAFALLNVFNLLPLLPLDGGRFLQETLFCRSRWLEAAFRVLMGGLTIFVGVVTQSWFLALVGLFVVLRTATVYKIESVAAALRGRPGFPAVVDPCAADVRVVVQTQAALQEQFPGVAPPAIEAQRIWEVWEKVNARPPRLLATAGLLAVYLLAFVAVPVAPVAYVLLSTREGEVVRPGPDGKPERVWGVRMGRFPTLEVPLNEAGLYHGTGRETLFGRTLEEHAWREGRPHGDWTRFDADGKPAVVVVFDGGTFVVRKDVTPEGVRERKREDLPPGYRDLLVQAETRGPYGPMHRFGLPGLLGDIHWAEAEPGLMPRLGSER
jgi:Zn-dependent protease